MKEKNIVVLMGGPSTEREVSLNTGKAILSALQAKGYKAVGIDLEPKRLEAQLREVNCEVVFNAVHGKYGEDGLLQGLLEMLEIPYTGSTVLANAMAMDKSISKRLFLQAGISTPKAKEYSRVQAGEALEQEILNNFALPMVVKSCDQGSSIGVTIVHEAKDLAAALKDAFSYSDRILVETFVNGREFTVTVIGKKELQVLPVIEIRPHSGQYDYASKYTKGATEYIVPAEVDDETAKTMQSFALQAVEVLKCSGVARVDMMMDENNAVYVLEVNTVPGMTATSLVPKAAAAAGISFEDLCEKILLMAVEK